MVEKRKREANVLTDLNVLTAYWNNNNNNKEQDDDNHPLH